MRAPATACTALAAALAAVLAAGCRSTTSVPQPEAVNLGIEEDVAIGRAVAPRFAKLAGGSLDDLAVQAYVRAVGERVARSTPARALPYEFTVLDSGAPAAYALPGGPVYVTRGLLARLRSEGQLAAALAHQLAHINAGHAGRALRDRLGAAALGDVLVAASDTAARGDAAARSLDRAAAAVRDLRYDPEAEHDADRLGLDYMVAAGYNPLEAVRFANLCVAMSADDAPGPACLAPGRDGRADAVEAAVDRKYQDRGGRVADEEYGREVLARIKP